MATAIVLSEEQDRILAEIFRLYKSGEIGSSPRRTFAAAELVIYRATVIGAGADNNHAPGVTQPVQLCDYNWAAITGETPDAINESVGLGIDDGTRIYIMPGANEAYAILTPLDCGS